MKHWAKGEPAYPWCGAPGRVEYADHPKLVDCPLCLSISRATDPLLEKMKGNLFLLQYRIVELGRGLLAGELRFENQFPEKLPHHDPYFGVAVGGCEPVEVDCVELCSESGELSFHVGVAVRCPGTRDTPPEQDFYEYGHFTTHQRTQAARFVLVKLLEHAIEARLEDEVVLALEVENGD
jgi:hypothetical protein